MKNGVNWGNGFAIGDGNTKIHPQNALFFRVTRSFTFVTFKADISIKWKLMYSRISF